MIERVDSPLTAEARDPRREADTGRSQARFFAELVGELERDVRSSAEAVSGRPAVEGWAVFAESVQLKNEMSPDTAPARAASSEGLLRASASDDRQVQVAASSLAASNGASAGLGVRKSETNRQAELARGPSTTQVTARSFVSALESNGVLSDPARGAALQAGADTRPSEESGMATAPSTSRSREVPAAFNPSRHVSANISRTDAVSVEVAVRLFQSESDEQVQLQQRLQYELSRMGLVKYRLLLNGVDLTHTLKSEEINGH